MHESVGEMHSTEIRQQWIVRVLAPLRCMREQLGCILGSRDLNSTALQSIGFSVCNEFQANAGTDCSPNVEALLVTTVGNDITEAKRVVKVFNTNPNAPLLIPVVIAPLAASVSEMDALMVRRADSSPEESLEFAKGVSRMRAEFLEAGADDVITLLDGEVLLPHRVLEVLQKSEFLAKKFGNALREHVAGVESKCTRKLQAAHKKFLFQLPGHGLDSIPVQDASLTESIVAGGNLAGVGTYVFTRVLGAGAFGQVYKAEHPKYGTVAVKVVPKESFKSAHGLFALDRELCIMQFLEPHPNVVRAIDVMQADSNFYAVMEYAGLRHLHCFVKKTVESTGAATLPKQMIQKFLEQEAAAVMHLHNAMVCHRDLKPNNWIVSDSGETLRLADFGLAAQLVGHSQPLVQCCGSLPFCAPEVFGIQSSKHEPDETPDGRDEPEVVATTTVRTKRHGYNGLAADIWSLGVNFLELLMGPYGIEKALGWKQRAPKQHEIVLSGLRGIPDILNQPHPNMEPETKTLLASMLTIDPSQRTSIGQVVGPGGLGMGHAIRPPRGGRRLTKPKSDANAVASALVCKLGGASTVSSVLRDTLDRLIATPGIGDCIGTGVTAIAWKEFLTGKLLELLQMEEGSDDAVLRTQLREYHRGCNVLRTHVRLIIKWLGTSLKRRADDPDCVGEAARKIDGIRPELTDDCSQRVSEAQAQDTWAWRSKLCQRVEQSQINIYVKNLKHALSTVPGLSGTSFGERSESEIEQWVSCYFDKEADRKEVFLPIGEKCLSDEARLLLLCRARTALLAAQWAPEDVETIFMSMLAECDEFHANA